MTWVSLQSYSLLYPPKAPTWALVSHLYLYLCLRLCLCLCLYLCLCLCLCLSISIYVYIYNITYLITYMRLSTFMHAYDSLKHCNPYICLQGLVQEQRLLGQYLSSRNLESARWDELRNWSVLFYSRVKMQMVFWKHSSCSLNEKSPRWQ